MNRAAMSVVLVTVLGAGCASTGLNSPDGWHVVKSKRFTMYTATTLSHSELLNGLEYHYAALASSFFKKDIGNVDVLYLESEDFVGTFGNRRSNLVLHRVPGNGKIGKDGLIILKAVQGDLGAAEAITQVFIDRVLPTAPLWFHEGFASYGRSGEYKEGDNRRIACFGGSAANDPRFAFDARFLPLDKLFAMSWDEYDGDDARTWYKNTAHMLIDFAMHGDGGKRQPAMGAMVEGFLAGKDTAAIIKTAFPDMDVKQLSDKVIAHGTDLANRPTNIRGLCPIGFPIPPEKVADIGDHALEAADPADIRPVIAAIMSLPQRDDGFPGWYPEETIARAEKSK
jgi:hypothetical protein